MTDQSDFGERLMAIVLEELTSASPGSSKSERAAIAGHIIAQLGNHLGVVIGMQAGMAGLDSAAIDALLESTVNFLYERAGAGREMGLLVDNEEVRAAILRGGKDPVAIEEQHVTAAMLAATLARRTGGYPRPD